MNQALARHYWPSGNAVGKRLRLGTQDSKTPWATIVGIVADTKLGSPDTPDQEQIYSPAQQFKAIIGSFASPGDVFGDGGYIIVALRAAAGADDQLTALHRRLA